MHDFSWKWSDAADHNSPVILFKTLPAKEDCNLGVLLKKRWRRDAAASELSPLSLPLTLLDTNFHTNISSCFTSSYISNGIPCSPGKSSKNKRRGQGQSPLINLTSLTFQRLQDHKSLRAACQLEPNPSWMTNKYTAFLVLSFPLLFLCLQGILMQPRLTSDLKGSRAWLAQLCLRTVGTSVLQSISVQTTLGWAERRTENRRNFLGE